MLSADDLEVFEGLSADKVDYPRVGQLKLPLLRKAYQEFKVKSADKKAFNEFKQCHHDWLEDFALFMALKDAHNGIAWVRWEREFVRRDADALQRARQQFSEEIETHNFAQYVFFKQWTQLRQHCIDRRIRIMGDLPIYVAHDSADVWANPEFFLLDENGNPKKIAGVPPDYFSASGQLWGNPIYNWEKLRETGYRWWIERFRAVFQLFDIVRVDHFRGFEAYWEVPGGEATAINGRWTKAPGVEVFAAVQNMLGDLPIVAENLGVITPEVEAIRDRFRFPGMAILQFAFGTDPQGPSFRPHNYSRDLVAYTGTHDNDTIVGWWTSSGAESTRTEQDMRHEREYASKYLNTNAYKIHWTFIRALMASVANTVIFPFQDVMGLGNEARMNTPSKLGGNWRWRFRRGMLTDDICQHLKELTTIYERLPQV